MLKFMQNNTTYSLTVLTTRFLLLLLLLINAYISKLMLTKDALTSRF